MIGVRYNEAEETWEGKCDTCLEFWPVDLEFWDPGKRGVRHCRACIREQNVARKRRQRENPDYRAQEAVAWRERRALSVDAARERHALRQRVRYRFDHEFREQRLARTREYYAANRERIRESARAAYRARRAA